MSGCRTDDAAAAGVEARAAESVVAGPTEAVPVGASTEGRRRLPLTRSGTTDHREREHEQQSARSAHSVVAQGTGPSRRPQRPPSPRSGGPARPPTCALLRTGLRTDGEAQVGWVWTAVVVWVLLAVPAAVLLGGRSTAPSAGRSGRRAPTRSPPSHC